MCLFVSFRKSNPHQNCQLIGWLLIEILGLRFYGGFDFLKLINKYIVSDKRGGGGDLVQVVDVDAHERAPSELPAPRISQLSDFDGPF